MHRSCPRPIPPPTARRTSCRCGHAMHRVRARRSCEAVQPRPVRYSRWPSRGAAVRRGRRYCASDARFMMRPRSERSGRIETGVHRVDCPTYPLSTSRASGSSSGFTTSYNVLRRRSRTEGARRIQADVNVIHLGLRVLGACPLHVCSLSRGQTPRKSFARASRSSAVIPVSPAVRVRLLPPARPDTVSVPRR